MTERLFPRRESTTGFTPGRLTPLWLDRSAAHARCVIHNEQRPLVIRHPFCQTTFNGGEVVAGKKITVRIEVSGNPMTASRRRGGLPSRRRYWPGRFAATVARIDGRGRGTSNRVCYGLPCQPEQHGHA